DGTGGGLMVSATSVLGSYINEGRVYASEDRQNASPYLAMPNGVVTVASEANGVGQQIATLQFGGNPSLPRNSRQTLQEASDEISWLSSSGAHRVKLGALLNRDRSASGAVPNRWGTFVYNSLADLDAGRPAIFARNLVSDARLSDYSRLSGSDNAALYLG